MLSLRFPPIAPFRRGFFLVLEVGARRQRRFLPRYANTKILIMILLPGGTQYGRAMR
jgi:hypothetical protein